MLTENNANKQRSAFYCNPTVEVSQQTAKCIQETQQEGSLLKQDFNLYINLARVPLEEHIRPLEALYDYSPQSVLRQEWKYKYYSNI